jgi:hypothetical protein
MVVMNGDDLQKIEEMVVTLFLAVFSIGVGAGSMLCNRLLRGRISARTVPWGILGLALFSIDVWLANPAPPIVGALTPISDFLAAPANWRILADLFGIAVSGGVFIVPLYALLQTASDERRRARTIGANNIVNAAAMVLSAILTMALVAAGLADATWTLAPKHEWDVAAGVALVLAAGGQVRTLDGSALVFNQPRPWLSGLAAYPETLAAGLAPSLTPLGPPRSSA